MNVKNYVFTNSEIETLKFHRDNLKDGKSKIRIIAMLLLKSNPDTIFVSDILGMVPRTIENWFKKYIDGGVKGLIACNYTPKKAKLDFFQINQVVIWVIHHNPDTTKEVAEYIREKFNINYCPEAVRQLLLKRGIKLIRAKIIPGNPKTIEEQRQFITRYNDLKNSITPGSKILFGDAMHLVHQNLNGFFWGDPSFPPILETNSSRKRLNILGAYDPESLSIVHLTGEENCDAIRVIEFFETIRSAFPDAPKIYIILDNAKYFHARIVREWLDNNPFLKTVFLPSYSPNLNLIERFWKFAKKKLVKRKYYKQYKNFRANVFRFLNNTHEYHDELKSLMVEKFQIVHA